MLANTLFLLPCAVRSLSVWMTVKRTFSLIFLCVCVCVCVCVCEMTVDHGILFLFVGVPVKSHHFALFLWICCFMLEGIIDTVMKFR